MSYTTTPLIEIAAFDPPAPRAILRDADELVAFMPMAEVIAEDSRATTSQQRQAQAVLTGFTYFQSDDVLVAKITPCFENGKIALASIDQEHGFGSTEFHVIRAKPGRLWPAYLLHYLRQTWIRSEGERRMTGSAGQRRVPKHFLETLKIPLPPIEEQRRIAAILDQAEALRAKRRQALAKLDTLTQSLFLEMFGDPVFNPKNWPLLKLAEIGAVITGNTPSRTESSYFGSDIEWVKSDNLNTPRYYVTSTAERLSVSGKAVARIVPPNSILVTCIAGSPSCIGNAAITDREVAFNQQINALVPRKGEPHFLYAEILAAKRKIQEASTNAMKGMVNKSRFENITLPFPPINLQREFVRCVLSTHKSKEASYTALSQSDQLFHSLQHRAFRGEL